MEDLSTNSSGDSMRKRNRKKYRKDKERQEGRQEYLYIPLQIGSRSLVDTCTSYSSYYY